MSKEAVLQHCFNNAWNNKCDGACEEHRGECCVVEVARWGYFSYCEEAIAEDTRRGLTVTKLNIVQMSRVDDNRTADERYRQEMGMNMIEGQGR